MKKIEINIPSNPYNIYIKKGLLEKLDEFIKEIYTGKKIIIITDTNVDKLYGKKAEEVLSKSFDVRTIVVPNGEKSKSLECLESIYTKLIQENVTRKDCIVGLGGGVVRRFSRICCKYNFKRDSICTSTNNITCTSR